MTENIKVHDILSPERKRKNSFFSLLPGLFLLLILFAMPYKLCLFMDRYRQEELFSSSALAFFALSFLLFMLPEKWEKLRILFAEKTFTIPFVLLFLFPC